jgi:hypothetical protein
MNAKIVEKYFHLKEAAAASTPDKYHYKLKNDNKLHIYTGAANDGSDELTTPAQLKVVYTFLNNKDNANTQIDNFYCNEQATQPMKIKVSDLSGIPLIAVPPLSDDEITAAIKNFKGNIDELPNEYLSQLQGFFQRKNAPLGKTELAAIQKAQQTDNQEDKKKIDELKSGQPAAQTNAKIDPYVDGQLDALVKRSQNDPQQIQAMIASLQQKLPK